MHTPKLAANVRFGDRLSPDEMRDTERRRAVLTAGIASIRERFAGLEPLLDDARNCIAIYREQEETIRRLHAFLEETGIGVMTENDPGQPRMSHILAEKRRRVLFDEPETATA